MVVRCGRKHLSREMPEDVPMQYEIDVMQLSSDGPSSAYKIFVNGHEEGNLIQELTETTSLVKFHQDGIEKGLVSTRIDGDADWVKTARTLVAQMLRREWPGAHINWYTRR